MADDTADFVFDTFRDQPDKLPQEACYDKLRTLVSGYGDKLHEAESTLNEAFGEVWDLNDPIVLAMGPAEDLTIEEALGEKAKESNLLYKVLLVFSSLVAESGDLVEEARTRLFPALSTYGDQPDGKDIKDGDGQLSFGRMLPLLTDTWSFVERCCSLIENIVQQLASIHTDRNRKARADRRGLAAYQEVHFTQVWRALADVLGVLITLDEMIRQNEHFQETCTWYKRIMKNVSKQPDDFDTDLAKAKKFCLLLDHLESALLDDDIYQSCLNRVFDDPSEGIFVRDNLVFMHEFDYQLRDMFTYIRRGVGMSVELDKRELYVGLSGLYVLYYTFFRDKLRSKTEDKKFFKSLFDVHKTVPVIHIYGDSYFCPAEWLARRVPDMANQASKDPQKEHASACRAILQTYQVDPLRHTVDRLYQDVVTWACEFESRDVTAKADMLIGWQARRIVQGVSYAKEASALLKAVFGTHRMTSEGMSKKKVLILCKLTEMLKSIMGTFQRKSPVIANLMTVMTQFITYSMSNILFQFRKKLKDNLSRLEPLQVDQLSAIELMQRILHGPPARSSIIVLKNAMSIVVAKSAGLMKDQDFDTLRQYVARLEIIAGWQQMVREACDCSLIYWVRDVIPVYFRSLLDEPHTASSIRYMFFAFSDCSRALLSAQHLADKKSLFRSFVKEVKGYFTSELLEPLQQEIEKVLRLSGHSKVLGEVRHSLGAEQWRDLQLLLDIPPLRFFGERMHIRDMVEHYLASTYYTMAAMEQKDWETYERMRALAKERFNMDLTEAHLPGTTQDQSLDLLTVMRQIPDFVTRYTYNINNQIFVERPDTTKSKHLNVVNVTHVADAIRTHGTGIMTTSVNFVYAFLKKKFHMLSSFLFDDHVRSRLLKDNKWFAERKVDLQNMYPVKRADKFVKDIRKLGTVDQQYSYLDQFRKLITEIGNALGYVRLVRTGGMRAISRQISFVPTLDEIPEFAELLEDDNFKENPDDPDEEVEGELPETSVQAAKNLDAVLSNQSKRFSEGSDYFKLLEDIFKEEMNSEKNAHLQNFATIIPPLSISFIDHIIACKDKLNKRKDAPFSDDGFALGVSFLLKLLNIQDRFDALHWFSSVDAYYSEENRKVAEQVAAAAKALREREALRKGKKQSVEQASEEDGEISTLNLTANRIKDLKREYELMFYSFRSAKVFFKDKVEAEPQDDGDDIDDSFDEDDLDEA